MKTFFQIIFTILFVFSSIFFIFSKGVENTFLEIDFYKELLEKTDASGLLLGIALTDANQNSEEDFEIENLFSGVVTKEWIDDTLLYLINDIIIYAKGEKEEITAKVNIKEQKDTLSQLLENEEEEIMLNDIPDEIILKDILEDNNVLYKIDVFRAYYGFYKIAIYSLLVALLIIIIVLAKPLNGMKWIGCSMTFSALFLFLALITFKNVIKQFAVDLNGMLSNINVSEVLDIVILRFHPLIYFYFIVGLLLVVISFIIKKYKKK